MGEVPESTRVEIFPELAAAAAAARRLSSKGLPEGMEFDRLVVDEAQDLTLTEFWMLLELLRACRKRMGKSPWLLIAGDAGQRVEASGFEWGRYTELLSSRWRKPATFDLHEHVRCPSRIAAVVNRSNIFYSLVDKNRRPEKQQPVVESEHVTGHALYVRVDRTEQANGLVEQLAALEGTAVITAADEPPAWLDERRRTLVLTPGEAKGLEYQRVCVLVAVAAGRAVCEVDQVIVRWNRPHPPGRPRKSDGAAETRRGAPGFLTARRRVRCRRYGVRDLSSWPRRLPAVRLTWWRVASAAGTR